MVRGHPITQEPGKLQILLAGLLLRANEVVSTDQLIAWLWDGRPPAHPRGALHTYVRRLRQALGYPATLVTTGTGYRLTVATEEHDLLRFRALLDQADRVPGASARADLLTEAMGLWRGPVLADVPSDALRCDAQASLEEERLVASEQRFDAELRTGRHSELVQDLRTAALETPYRERTWAQLMLALYRAGRQAESLEIYRHVRDLLIDQLGIEPGAALRTLHERILRSDPSLAVLAADQYAGAPLATVPAQLPPDVVGFVGREDLVDELAAALRPIGSRTGVPIVVLAGPPGIGKTALAVHVGHRIRHAFPDGQLHADLRGTHEPTDGREPPQTPSQVLPPFLRALGTPPDRIPAGFDEQLTLFRSMLSGRNVLLVLDDAASADQVRPLIPGDAGCSVLITSQHRLGGLVASNSAQVIDVETLSRAESRALIVGIVGGRSTTLHPDLVSEVVELCGHLPLALRIAAANLQHLPASGFRSYIADLQESNRRASLTTAVGSEAAVSATVATAYATVATAYATVGASDRRMLRFLGLFAGADITAGAAGALADVASAQAHNALRRLTAAGLMQEHRPGRYQLHDLVHRFALERLDTESGQPERLAAIDRLGSWYVAGVRGSAAILHGEFVRLVPDNGTPPADFVRFSDVSVAAAWLAAEHRNLGALVRYFAEHEPRRYAWHLADGLRGHFWTGWFWDEWEESTTAALWAARESGDQPGIAAMSRSLGNLYNTTGDYTLALSLHAESLRVHEQLGMGEETAATLNNITLAHMSLGRFDEAHHTGVQALAAARKVGSRRAESAALALLGSVYWMRDELTAAAELLTSALETASALDLHHISVYVLRSLGLVRLALRDVDDARDHLKRAVILAERIGSVYDASVAHYGLALAHREVGDHRVALDHAERARAAFRDSGDSTYEVETSYLISTITADLQDRTATASPSRRHARPVPTGMAGYRRVREVGPVLE